MPVASTFAQTRLNNIRLCLTGAVDSLELLANSANLLFLKPIAITARTLLTSVEVNSEDRWSAYIPLTVYQQSVRHNKNECTQLMDHIHEVLYGIVELHIKSDTGGDLPPKTLENIAQFTK
ncbi:hypothetical protein B0H19DRAFT_1073853 [Mycena capillaripes]|nr:hypothetical protein B0H19DRAFT_1073853 [Mycena capillaripes]